MKTCISTYSFARLISGGSMTHFDVLDKIHAMGVPGAELVLDDQAPERQRPDGVCLPAG